MAEHKFVTMDGEVLENTFAGFIEFVQVSIYVIIGLLIFMALVNA